MKIYWVILMKRSFVLHNHIVLLHYVRVIVYAVFHFLPPFYLNLECVEKMVNFMSLVSQFRVLVDNCRNLQPVINFYILKDLLFMASLAVATVKVLLVLAS